MAVTLATQIQGPVAVFGDLHGHVSKTLAILDKLRRLPDFEQRWLVFIGDLVDRGPNPSGAVQLVLDLLKEHSRTTAITGNHEFAMASALGWVPSPEEAAWNQRWMQYYDAETTFASYGAEFGNLADLDRRVPFEHKELLTSLPWHVRHPEYFFVHAGLDPYQPFEIQQRVLAARDFTLLRPPWLCSKTLNDCSPPPDCPYTVVSGHMKVPQVILRPNRILIDTTGGEEGDLSCVLLPEKLVLTSGAGMTPMAVADAPVKTKRWWKFW